MRSEQRFARLTHASAEFGIQPQRFAIGGHRLVRPAQPRQRRRQLEMAARVEWLQSRDRLQMFGRLGQAILSGEQTGQLDVCFQRVGRDCHDLAKCFDRLVALAGAQQGVGQVHLRRALARIDGQGAAESGNRLAKSLLPGEQHAQIVERRVMIGIELERSGQVPGGLVELVQVDAHRGQQVPGIGVVGLAGHDLAIDLMRFDQLAGLMEVQARGQHFGLGGHGRYPPDGTTTHEPL